MKTLKLILLTALLIPLISNTCQAQTSQKEDSGSSSDKIEAYYFHFTARCMTCKTVEAKTKENLEILYPEKIKQGKITFQSINLDDDINKPLAEKLQVSGQTLMIVKGNQKVILTNEGFLYAVGQPEKFKAIIKEKVDGLK
jgi:hypothetical protein